MRVSLYAWYVKYKYMHVYSNYEPGIHQRKNVKTSCANVWKQTGKMGRQKDIETKIYVSTKVSSGFLFQWLLVWTLCLGSWVFLTNSNNLDGPYVKQIL